MNLSCTVCSKSSNIKKCAKCSETPYCSRECQKADWKAHKKICGKGSPQPKLTPPKGLDEGITNPFTRLDNGTWLHGRSETDTYRILLDAYRLRADDDFKMAGDMNMRSMYAGQSDALGDFQDFLDDAEERPGLLPTWWDEDKRRTCENMGMDDNVWQNLKRTTKKGDIIEHYGDGQFPMQLRMFAEAVLQRGPGGQNGTGMMKMMASMEQGNMGDRKMTSIDTLTGNVTNLR